LLPIARKVSVAEDIPERIGIGFPDIEDAVDAARKTRTVASNVSKTTVQASPSTTETEGWAAKTESELDERFDGERKQEGLKPSRK